MKDFLKNLYKYLYNTEILPAPTVPVVAPKLPPVKSNSEKLLDYAYTLYNTDPTPSDEQIDNFACVHSLTTLLNNHLGNFTVMSYTPVLLEYIRKDTRFKEIEYFKEGAIIISPTTSGAGRITGHCGIIAKDGKILSNSSATGLWLDKFTHKSWVDRYSKDGGLDIHFFELL